MEDENLYRRLQRHLDRMPVPFPATESGVEIRLLKRLFTPADARVTLALSMIPEPAGVIHRRLRREMALEELRDALASMAGRGLINGLRGPRGPRYCKAPIVIGFYESQVNRLTEDVERDFITYLHERLGQALAVQPTQQMRTVPVNRPIASPDRLVARHDDIAEYVRTCEGPFAALNCICQQGKDLLSEPCRLTTHREHCLTFGAAARSVVERGVGRPVTREEMLGLLQLADREGLVLQPQNTQKPLFVCCCCGCCCGVLTVAKTLPRPTDFYGSNYRAEVTSDECQECGLCATRCPMDAVSADPSRPTTVDEARCIGCGLCVSTCPSGAVRMVARPAEKVPPTHVMKLYTQMYRERYGALGLAAAFGRNVLGLKT